VSKIAVTGATGFVGGHLVQELLSQGHTVRSLVRRKGTAPSGTEEIALGDFTQNPDWRAALEGQDAVICLAARVHVMKETLSDPIAAYRKTNVRVTESIANAAVETGVPRLVFLSSIKVNGERTSPGQPFSANDAPRPEDPYGVSKWEAEQVLNHFHRATGLEVVIVRSPLVYGPGVGGNFLRLLRLVDSGIPLPFGSADNKRAMISVDNLSDALITASMMDAVGTSVLLVKDHESLSTAQLLRSLAEEFDKPSRLFRFPAPLLSFALRSLGKRNVAERLLGSLDVEISSQPQGFSWRPSYSTQETLKNTVDWYRQHIRESA
jgi:UDP-glucose 4-epimerase